MPMRIDASGTADSQGNDRKKSKNKGNDWTGFCGLSHLKIEMLMG
jgi:hypothetical protein